MEFWQDLPSDCQSAKVLEPTGCSFDHPAVLVVNSIMFRHPSRLLILAIDQRTDAIDQRTDQLKAFGIERFLELRTISRTVVHKTLRFVKLQAGRIK